MATDTKKEVTPYEVRDAFDWIQESSTVTNITCSCCGEARNLTSSDCQSIADSINDKIDFDGLELNDSTIEDAIREYLGE